MSLFTFTRSLLDVASAQDVRFLVVPPSCSSSSFTRSSPRSSSSASSSSNPPSPAPVAKQPKPVSVLAHANVLGYFSDVFKKMLADGAFERDEHHRMLVRVEEEGVDGQTFDNFIRGIYSNFEDAVVKSSLKVTW